jgi:hypothetical protein
VIESIPAAVAAMGRPGVVIKLSGAGPFPDSYVTTSGSDSEALFHPVNPDNAHGVIRGIGL